MGILFFMFKPFSKVFFLIIMGYFLIKIVLSPPSKVTINVLLGCAYFAGAEILFRMTKGGIAYEASKYLVILFVLMGMFYKGLSGKGYPFFIYLILLVPSILVASVTLTFDARFRTNIAFVLSGPVCLGIAALFCYDRKVTFKDLNRVLAYMVLPIISTTTYLFLYNPSIKATLSGTASNLAASGGFGPNQVATILGLGIFIIVVRFFLNSPTLFLKIINLIVLGAMSYRAIVTFSRGGVVASIIIVTVFLGVLYMRSRSRKRIKMTVSFISMILIIMGTWTVSSNETNGLIDKRYANQNARGVEKKDITTGRVDLFKEEIEGFLSSPFLGIGASRVKDRRVEAGVGHLPSHNEIGRLLSEHGFLGIIILMILIIKPLSIYLKNKKNIYFLSFFCFWFATINHSGLRIAAPSFIYALCLLNVTYEKPPIHRKQLKH
ncbi:O-antigen ligase family protein [Winogradskyella sp. E313]|uniref:O-antigen ligase family protein n=2 Tax=Winogradskyella immobilis TaxID=2816852 RepID=A0ABS8ENU0_9FLAO|nr:O-antigen ligase family protein [Winogradskyella immobilis]MCC1484883.1 O-antigen ligase family protein [Winogradskyella immobilis]